MEGISANTTVCPICGGRIKVFSYGTRKCTCCDEIFSVNYADLDKLNRANELRKKNAFEEAKSIYDEILEEDPTFPEANYGALLCQYGIEYVMENNKEIPTIHRPINNYKILSTPYASALLENTAGEDRDFYFSRLNELEDLRTEIEAKSATLPKYDVFISCKITEEGSDNKVKTEESKWGEMIYEKLTNIGLKVFFSPVSLPATNGAYEPIIYSALQSSKYLIVLATTAENLNSKWIKNEWGRFLDLRKQQGNDKQYKLIIKEEVEKGVPEQLKDVSYINHDKNLKWLDYLIQAVKEVFKNIEEYRGFDFDIDRVDLGMLKIPKSKKLMSNQLSYTYLRENSILQNPYDVSLIELKKDYTEDKNLERWKQTVELRLESGKFNDAKRELKKYVDYVQDKSSLDFEVLMLKLLVDNSAKTLEEFFTEKAETFVDFDLMELIINKIPAGKEKGILVNMSDYIIDSIINHKDNNAIEFYKLIAGINSDIVRNLNNRVMHNIKYLLSNQVKLQEFLDTCSPYVATYDLREFINLSNTIVKDLCSRGYFDAANRILEKIYEADPQNSSALLSMIMIKNNAKTMRVLLTQIEEKDKYEEIEELIPNLFEAGVIKLTNEIKSRSLELLQEGKFEPAYSWVDILARTEFEGRIEFFKQVITLCKTNVNAYKVFNVAVHTLDEDNKSVFIKSCIEYSRYLLRFGQYEVAKSICEDASLYDSNNGEILRLELLADMESSTNSFKTINKLKDISIVEKLLIIQSSQYARNKILNELINACLVYLSDNDDIDENIFTVFNKLLTYHEDIEEILNKILKFGQLCLANGLFDKAEWYFKKIININKTYPEAYWGMILVKLQCRNEDEINERQIRINSFPEYDKMMSLLIYDKEKASKYDLLLLEQEESIKASIKANKKSKNKKIILVAAGGIAAVVAIVVAIVLLV